MHGGPPPGPPPRGPPPNMGPPPHNHAGPPPRGPPPPMDHHHRGPPPPRPEFVQGRLRKCPKMFVFIRFLVLIFTYILHCSQNFALFLCILLISCRMLLTNFIDTFKLMLLYFVF